MKKSFLLTLLIPLFFAFSSDIQKKVIREKNFDIEFYVSLKKIKTFVEGREYFWFKSGEIHRSISRSGGSVLHHSYNKYFRSNQLAEQGNFKFGLKNGTWKEWYENGNLKSSLKWSNGYKHGDYFLYNIYGKVINKGTYKNNLKSGIWIDYMTKDTLNYKKDKVFLKESKPKKEFFLKRLFKKKNINDKTKNKRVKPEKESFFKRLFKKKDKTEKEKKPTDKKTKNESFFKRLFKKKKGKEIKTKN